MNYSIIRYVTGWIVLIEGVLMLFPMLTSLIYAEYADVLIFLICAVVCIAIGGGVIAFKPRNRAFYAREGFVIVGLSWIVLSLIGAVPFYISGAIPSFVDALFETVSGFTTTGASILADVESLSHGMLFWRSFTHWIGGMGVLVFMLALLPMTGGHSMYLMKAESPGPSVSKLVPNLRKTAVYLYGIYFVLTVVQFVLLLSVGKMPVFDAVCIALGTAGTGGFSVVNTGMAGYTVAAQIITTVFMLLFGTNFVVYFLLLKKQWKSALMLEEIRWYFGLYFGISALIILNLMLNNNGSFLETAHQVLFHTASVMTTTGFATVDFNLWPEASRMLMVVLMCIGACAGSTSGGFKVSRVALLFKNAGKEMLHLIHPRSVKLVKMDGKPIEKETLGVLPAYLFCYIVIIAVSVVIVALDDFDTTTTITSVIATVNNIGPGLGEAGPMGNFSAFSDLSKIVFVIDMLLGRLEIFPLLLMFVPSTWKK